MARSLEALSVKEKRASLGLHHFCVVAITKCYTFPGLNNRDIFPRSSGGWRPTIKAGGRAPSEACEGRLLHAPPLASGGRLVFGISLLQVITGPPPSLSHALLPVCVSVSKFPLL